jgi:4-amino-4-deoxy-L-arabinose transferase-like glycosyltransferase
MCDDDKATTVAYWAKLTLVALALRLLAAFYLFVVVPQEDDPFQYAKQAARIMRGEDGGHQYFCPPGRSYCLIPFFWAFGESETTCRANAVAFDVAGVLLAAVLAHQVLRRRSAARMAGWIAAFYSPAVMISGWCYSENVTLFAITGSFCFALLGLRTLEKSRWCSLAAWLAAGALLGLTIVTRPSAFSVLFLAILAWLGILAVPRLRSRLAEAGELPATRVLAAGVVFVLAAVACVVPPMLHHARMNCGWVVSTNNEMNLFLGNNPFTPNYKTWHLGGNVAKAMHIPGYKEYLASFESRPDRRSAMVHEAIRYIRQRPDLFLLRTVNRIRAFWGFDHIAAATVRGGWPQCGKLRPLICLAVEGGGYCFTMLLVICGFFLVSPATMAKKDALLLVAVVLAYQLPYTLSFAYSIYHFPVMGLLFPFAGLSLEKAWRERGTFWQSIKGRKWLWIALAVFVLMQLEYACQVMLYEGT